MEILSLHIEYLLLHHDCVVVPGIGAFINVRQAPTFDSETGFIHAPYNEVIFNPSLKSDDGLLAKSFARKNEVSYREGAELMLRSIADLGNMLASEKEATVGRLGILCKEQEGNIRFHPYKSPRNLAYQIGRIEVPFSNSNIKRNNSSTSVKESSFQNQNESSDIIGNKETEKTFDKRKERKLNFEKNYYIPVNKTFTKVAASVLALLIVSIAFINKPLLTNDAEERASVLPIDKVIDSAIQNNQHSGSLQGEIKSNESDEKKEEVQTNEKGITSAKEANFYLIVATCTTPMEAEKFIKKYSDSGYPMTIINSTKYYRVSAMSDDSRQKLIELKNSSEFKENFPHAWIWKKI